MWAESQTAKFVYRFHDKIIVYRTCLFNFTSLRSVTVASHVFDMLSVDELIVHV